MLAGVAAGAGAAMRVGRKRPRDAMEDEGGDGGAGHAHEGPAATPAIRLASSVLRAGAGRRRWYVLTASGIVASDLRRLATLTREENDARQVPPYAYLSGKRYELGDHTFHATLTQGADEGMVVSKARR